MLPGHIGGVPRVNVLHQSLDPVLAYPRRHGRQREDTVWSLRHRKVDVRAQERRGFLLGSKRVSYVNLEAVVPLDLVLRHAVTLCQIDLSFQLRRLRTEKHRRLTGNSLNCERRQHLTAPPPPQSPCRTSGCPPTARTRISSTGGNGAQR